jgi:hypothetical protein
MRLIAHRGNVDGPNPSKENHPIYIESAILLGFDVEIDVWWENDHFYLGHDNPTYLLENLSLLSNEKVWCHAKNLLALDKLLQINNCNYFWHQNDDFTLTSKGFIWTYPGKQLCDRSVCVINENLITKNEFKKIHDIMAVGICSDYVEILKSY